MQPPILRKKRSVKIIHGIKLIDYYMPQILDLDTENDILSLIKKLKGKITFIIVAHRLNTLSICDRIIKIKSGYIDDVLSPKDLKK